MRLIWVFVNERKGGTISQYAPGFSNKESLLKGDFLYLEYLFWQDKLLSMLMQLIISENGQS